MDGSTSAFNRSYLMKVENVAYEQISKIDLKSLSCKSCNSHTMYSFTPEKASIVTYVYTIVNYTCKILLHLPLLEVNITLLEASMSTINGPVEDLCYKPFSFVPE